MTSEVYTTSSLESRDDGLFPSLLSADYSRVTGGNGSAPLSSTYETNSQYLNPSVQESQDTSSEVEMFCESISSVLMLNIDDEEQSTAVVNLRFEVRGCIWTMDFNPTLEAPNFQLEVILSAQSAGDDTARYLVETRIVDIKSKSVVAKSLEGFDGVKTTLEQTALIVRKAVVKCEFPDFPEGNKGKRFKEVYKLNAKLKSGTFSTICRGVHRASGKLVAVKCVRRLDLPTSDDAAVYDEVAILASLSNPHILPLIDFFEEDETYYLVKELLTGGDVLEKIAAMDGVYDEGVARDIIANVLKALSHCHAQNVAHRDMNSKSLLLLNEDDAAFVKLTGFGFAARVHGPKSLTKQCGTPFFVAPEVLTRKPYDQEADLWSVGCLAFLLVSGNLPFVGSTQKDLFRKIVSGKFEFDEDEWSEGSKEAKDLITRLLVVDPGKRITAADALHHLWIQVPLNHLKRNTLKGAAQRIKIFHERTTPK